MPVRCPHIEAWPSRERCAWCGEYSAVGFHVPDEVWSQIVPQRFRENISCVRCFSRMGDERLVEWDRDIQFFPVSLATHLGQTRSPRDEIDRALFAGIDRLVSRALTPEEK